MTLLTDAPAADANAPHANAAAFSLDLEHVRAAAAVVRDAVDPTPLLPLTAVEHDAVWVKRDDVLPTGSFKVRGGAHLAATLTPAEHGAGLVTASTGNHAQSVAWAARRAGTTATIVMPLTAPQVKHDAVEALGARVVRHGDDLAASSAHARELVGAFVDPTDPRIVLGHATCHLELFESALARGLALEAVYVPIGSGTGAAGACVVRDALLPGCRVVGVQSSAAPAAWRSWRSGRPATATCRTRASGLATSASYESTQGVLRDRLDDFLLVSDDAIDDAARVLLDRGRVLAEGAGAAALAGRLADPRSGSGAVAVVCTGGNLSPEDVARLLA